MIANWKFDFEIQSWLNTVTKLFKGNYKVGPRKENSFADPWYSLRLLDNLTMRFISMQDQFWQCWVHTISKRLRNKTRNSWKEIQKSLTVKHDAFLKPMHKPKIYIMPWYCERQEDSMDQCPMPIYADQNSGIDPKYRSININFIKILLIILGINNGNLIGIDRHWPLIQGVLERVRPTVCDPTYQKHYQQFGVTPKYHHSL